MYKSGMPKSPPARKRVRDVASLRVRQGRELETCRSSVAIRSPNRLASADEPGFSQPAGSALYVPNVDAAAVAKPSKLRLGFQRARAEMTACLREMVSLMNTDFSVSEIELSASFDADGKFLGFGVGGAVSVKIRVKPTEASVGRGRDWTAKNAATRPR